MRILRNLAVSAHSQKALRFAQNLCSSLALPKIFALCSKPLLFSCFAQNLCASHAVSLNLAVLALSQKALRFAENLCTS
jgi:hypothetical protein